MKACPASPESCHLIKRGREVSEVVCGIKEARLQLTSGTENHVYKIALPSNEHKNRQNIENNFLELWKPIQVTE